MERINLDDGFMYGISAFETIAVEEGRPLFIDEHLERLNTTIRKLKIDTTDIDEHLILEYLGSLPMQEKASDAETVIDKGALKILVSQSNTVMSFRANPYVEEDYRQGFHVEFSPIRRNETSPFVYMKTANYGDNILEKKRAVREGFDEPIFQNSKGEICEGATSNLFFIKNKFLYTPKISCGLLPGIVRSWILKNYRVHETCIKPENISSYDEAFITNSLIGVMPINEFGKLRFRSREITDQIREGYECAMHSSRPALYKRESSEFGVQ